MKLLPGIFVVLLLLVSCTTREVGPTRESRIAIDSIYQLKVSQSQKQLDSMCTTYMDSVYRYAVDSMIREREDEMNQLVK